MIRIHANGEAVTRLQKHLAQAGFYRLAIDGDFGPGTDKALRAYQRSQGLVADGIAGPKTWRALAGGDVTRLLDQADLERAANALGAELAAVMAINEVESRGEGFLASGDPVILFERHVMRRQLRDRGIDTAPLDPDLVNSRPGGYLGGEAEHTRLERAKQIHIEAAIGSASWGLFQIMGYHAEGLGYASALDFEDAMRHSEGDQLGAFVRFIEADPALHDAVRRLDFEEVARRYNGPAYARNNYHRRMAAAYDRHSAALEATA